MVLTKVGITDANAQGLVWVQFHSDLMRLLANLQPNEELASASPSHIQNIVTALWDNGKGTKAFVLKVDGGVYRRVTIIGDIREASWVPGNSQRMIFVYTDFGEQGICSFEDLLPFSFFNEHLEFTPPQARIMFFLYFKYYPVLTNECFDDVCTGLLRAFGPFRQPRTSPAVVRRHSNFEIQSCESRDYRESFQSIARKYH